jgi:hypothetical protein
MTLLNRTRETAHTKAEQAKRSQKLTGLLRFLMPKEVCGILDELDATGHLLSGSSDLLGEVPCIYVALATLLPEEWRATASCAGLCYIQILDGDSQQCCVRVAATPRYLETTPSRKAQVLALSREQIWQILPWDRTLQRMETCCVREVLEVYARQLDLFPEQEARSDIPSLVWQE